MVLRPNEEGSTIPVGDHHKDTGIIGLSQDLRFNMTVLTCLHQSNRGVSTVTLLSRLAIRMFPLGVKRGEEPPVPIERDRVWSTPPVVMLEALRALRGSSRGQGAVEGRVWNAVMTTKAHAVRSRASRCAISTWQTGGEALSLRCTQAVVPQGGPPERSVRERPV
jgi:hypothetical protein